MGYNFKGVKQSMPTNVAGEAIEDKISFFKRLKSGLEKTRSKLSEGIQNVFLGANESSTWPGRRGTTRFARPSSYGIHTERALVKKSR